jgi:hypothetical protein
VLRDHGRHAPSRAAGLEDRVTLGVDMWKPIAVLLLLTLSSTTAYAYLDSGTGSMLVQA